MYNVSKRRTKMGTRHKTRFYQYQALKHHLKLTTKYVTVLKGSKQKEKKRLPCSVLIIKLLSQFYAKKIALESDDHS